MSDRLLSAEGQLGVRKEQITLLYQSMPGAIYGSLGLALFSSIALWDVVDRTGIAIWGASLLATSAIRLWFAYRFKHSFDSHDLGFWKNSFLISVFVTGVVWGALLLLYSPDWPVPYQFMAWIIYPGLITGAVVSQSAYYPAFVVFVSPLMISCAWVLLTLGRSEYGMMLLILVVFLVSVFSVAKRYNQTLVDAMEAKGRLAEANKKLMKMAMRDVLTGVPNRRAFEYQLQREWARCVRHKQSIALLMVDIDHFKDYNDRFGHNAGDACLKEVAAAIAEQLHRPCDLASRFGGEEFALLLPETDCNGANKVAEDILCAVRAITVPGMEHRQLGSAITVSIGVGCCTPTTESCATALIDEADKAMYRAKDDGRNCIRQ